jgi:recombination protein RecR
MPFSSKLIDNAVDQMATLPGIGKKTALRLVLHLLKTKPVEVERFSKAFVNMRNGIRECIVCHNLSDQEKCEICANTNRDESLVCVVQDIRDVMAIEATQHFNGLYHVLGGIISPMDGIGPEDLSIDSLTKRINAGGIKEVILALSTTMEGETTSFYVFRRMTEFNIPVTTIARGVALGDELEYADELTLGRSIDNRAPYENSLSR